MVDTYSDWLPQLNWIIPTIITVIITCTGFMFHNRRAVLTYHYTCNQIGISTNDNIHGNIEVFLGGKPFQNLHLVNIYLINQSYRDFENLEVKVWSPENTKLLTDFAHLEGTTKYLEYSPETQNIFNRLQEIKLSGKNDDIAQAAFQSNLNLYQQCRYFAVDTLSRRQSINFTFMTEVTPSSEPVLFLECHKKGVKLKYKDPYPPTIRHLWGVSIVHATKWGLAISLILSGLAIYFFTTSWLVGILCLMAGLFCNLFGVLIVKSYRWFLGIIIG